MVRKASLRSCRFTIRRAALRDIETLVHQRRAMWEDMGVRKRASLAEADQFYRRWAKQRLKDGTLQGWIVEDENGALAGGGCLWLQPVQPRPGYNRRVQPYLLSMYTEPAFRGKGVASRIVERAVDWTKTNKYPSLRLHASEMGRKLYSKLGFERAWEMKLEFRTRHRVRV